MSTPELHLLLPGDADARTGGYLYDARIRDGLRSLGWRVHLHGLDAAFPQPDTAALAHAARALAALPAGALVLVDGLALGAMPELVEREASRLRLLALVHHPLAEESGLAPALAARLRVSEQRALAASAHVVVTSRSTARALLAGYGVPPARTSVVEPGTEPAPISIGSGGPGVALLCVATLVPRKGHATLVEALSRLRHRRWSLVCAGSTGRDAETARAVRRQIAAAGLEQRIELVGEVDEATLQRLYHGADLFVLPTLHEGYGMALAEALARGLPLISTTAGAVPDTVGEDAGLLLPPGDAPALAAALARLMDEPALRAHLRTGALHRRSQLPTWDQACTNMARVLAQVAAGR